MNIDEIPYHRRIKMMKAPLSKELREKYGIRSAIVRKGDTVLVMRGDYKGHEGKVLSVSLSKMRITIEGINIKKADGTLRPVWIHPSKVMITKLDLTDKKRKEKFEKLEKLKKGE
ncbi:MAG: 50S ribosomal protein L24 [Candidatus Verstraetearchaeota archaeon]|jgi:large subunit ribosomal protein L24|nr:50S ribosomal protein L24 [Candidatus Verstraetearchaeota archaeon]